MYNKHHIFQYHKTITLTRNKCMSLFGLENQTWVKLTFKKE